MEIKLYSGFSKKPNSTSQPTGGTTKTVRLKDGCSVINPVFLLNGYDLSHNYLSWGSRYYYIDDIVILHNDLAEYHCSSDPLATFKTDIGNSSQYILRSASAFNGRIVDNYYPAKALNTHAANMITSPFDKNNGTFVIGMQGKGSGGNGGAVTYYAGNAAAVKALVEYMLGDPTTYDVSEISSQLLTCIFNPLQFIVSCMWFPFSVPTMNGDVNCGWWIVENSSLKPISSLDWGTNFTIPIPKHPKAATRGEYLNLLPYSKYVLEAGPWGIIPLDNFNLLDSSNLECDYKVDLMTGSGRLNIKYRGQLAYSNIQTTQVGVPIQLGQNVLNQGALTGAGTGIINTIKSAVTGDVSGMLFNGLGAIGNAAASSQAIPSMLGSNGTMAFFNGFGILADFLDVADDNNTENGRPLCEVRTISTLSGYMICENADLNTAASPAEKSTILSALNGGFYYE